VSSGSEVSEIVKQRVFTPMMGDKANEASVTAAAEKLKKPLEVMNNHLAKNEYLAGSMFSLADVFFLPYWQHFVTSEGKTLLADKSHVNAWWKRCSERPSWVKTLTFIEKWYTERPRYYSESISCALMTTIHHEQLPG
jgi:glutathione S-transferase